MPLLILFLLFAVTPVVSAGEKSGPWQTSFDNALKQAAEKNTLVLLDFTATWCGPCRLMSQTTFQDPEVLRVLQKVIPVKIDFDSNPNLASRYGVRSLPHLILVDQHGEEIERCSGYRDSEQFIDWLAETLERATSEKIERKPNNVEAIAAFETRIIRQGKPALDEMFDQFKPANAREREAFRTVLLSIAAKRPALLGGYLNDNRLSVRVMAGSALGNKIPAEAGYDPWKTAPEREAAIAKLKFE